MQYSDYSLFAIDCSTRICDYSQGLKSCVRLFTESIINGSLVTSPECLDVYHTCIFNTVYLPFICDFLRDSKSCV